MSDFIEIEVPELEAANVLSLSDFVTEHNSSLLELINKHNPTKYNHELHGGIYTEAMSSYLRKPFDIQSKAIHAIMHLFETEKTGIICGEMGTGKTLTSVAVADLLNRKNNTDSLILAPSHVCYKTRREVLETIPNAQVWVLNGSDCLQKLITLKAMLSKKSDRPRFYILGKVRMRMGFHTKPICDTRIIKTDTVEYNDDDGRKQTKNIYKNDIACCTRCSETILDIDGEIQSADVFLAKDSRLKCRNLQCREPLWTMIRKRSHKNEEQMVKKLLTQIPTIGPKTSETLIKLFGAESLKKMLSDNIYEFINLMDGDGELVFSDRQAVRMERAFGKLELSFGQGGYQASEFIKRYLKNWKYNLVVDEAHEYRHLSAQGHAMGVLSGAAKKVLLLTGTLTSGYATDIFQLLFRANPRIMLDDGYKPTRYSNDSHSSFASASMNFLQDFGVLKETFTRNNDDGDFKTAKGKKESRSVTKAPGFSPEGIVRFVLPYTVFIKLKDIDPDVLPSYEEESILVDMSDEQREAYERMESSLKAELKKALALGDNTLTGVVMNTLLRWPETCFQPEVTKHPRTRDVLHIQSEVVGHSELSPKEEAVLKLCLKNKRAGRRTLVYTIYTGKFDTGSRIGNIMKQAGLKADVLRSSVTPEKREDWIQTKVDAGNDVLICNPELVKTGLDLLDYPNIIWIQTGYNTLTLMQASRRSWRIGQTEDVYVTFFGYRNSAQSACLSLMANKVAVSQSTQGDMPESGLDSLNTDDESLVVTLARQIVSK